MGAVHKVTTSHVVSAPLASYIVRNGSRFKFSHDFVNIPITKLFCNMDNNIEDYVLQTDENEEGETKKFFSSAILDYICRPQKEMFEKLCAYDFYSQYMSCSINVQRRNKAKFSKDHPAAKYRICLKRGNNLLPELLCYVMPDSRDFGGCSILEDEETITLDKTDTRYIKMEEYAKKACILFCPFRTLKDLQINISNSVYFKEKVQDNTVTERHLQILQNIQDCHNAMDSGTPTDPLEKCTETPNKTKQNSNE